MNRRDFRRNKTAEADIIKAYKLHIFRDSDIVPSQDLIYGNGNHVICRHDPVN